MTTLATRRRRADAAQRPRGQRYRTLWIAALIGACLLSIIANIALGQYGIAPQRTIESLFAGPYGDTGVDATHSVIWNVRMPRVVLGLLVGAALGVAGALLQGLLGNPLAEPGVIGVTSGCAVGAAVAIVFNLVFVSTATVPVLAFISGIATAALVYLLSSIRGSVKVVTLILTGIAVNAVAGAAISFLVFLAPTTSREQIIFWQMGSLNGAQWPHVVTVLIPIAVCIALAIRISPSLDLLALGERAAAHAGANMKVLRPGVIALSTALCAAAVSFAGIISFVGLIVPHILRQGIGPSNRWLVPLSAIGGATLVTGADLVARILIPYSELPIGIFTALVGGPMFFVLLRRNLLKRGQL
ncbi:MULTISPECIES: iron ABC transporter permease [Corynebacterium]|uniref:FecCD family ABC transporter permease n=1 Tax=Corynebacterium TaxID=1716 RepID=UPI00124DE753|nr:MULTISPECIES: iron ABC transporter permease [Corynebacterium]MBV7281959.1 iron ABC transporter permease [Corynebacterium sp. TAE3-ERU30]MBV7301592.1 iron ABC transporter permease [Corynebacterium sp. TAE3-ERU2]